MMRSSLFYASASWVVVILAAGCSESQNDGDVRAPGPTAPSLAAAGPPVTGTGTGVLTAPPEVLFTRFAGPNRIEERRLVGVVQGALQGTFVEYVRGVVHPNGQVTFQGTMEFTGTLAGCGTGFLVAGLSGRGEAGSMPQTEANVRLIKQSTSTLHASGSGTVTQDGPFLTYEIRYVCK